MRVLVCDDEPDIRLLYRSAFEAAGAAVEVAEDGERAVDVASEWAPDLIILDLRMPKKTGAEALPELNALCPDASVIVVSAHLSLDQFSQMTELGAQECFDKIDFLGRIRGIVDRYGDAA
jgi:two-component system response regulator AtoC